MSAAREPWVPEREVEPDLAAELIARAAPGLAGAPLEPFGAGWDNVAYLVADAWVFRFPRREFAVEAMENEIRGLPRVAPQLPLAVPLPVHVGHPGEAYPWPYAGYRLVPGNPVVDHMLRAPLAPRSAARLGRFLAVLHRLDGDPLRTAGLPQDRIRRLDGPYRASQALERLERIGRRAPLAGAVDLVALLERGLPRGWSPRGDHPVHGDLDARHLLVDDGGRVTGAIDWGDLHLGEPALDLALAWTLFRPPDRVEFRRAYGEIDDDTWAAARFRAVHHSLSVLDWAESVRLDGLAAGARGWLANVLEA